MRNNNKGFTLVELIVVMAIIAVLAAILVPTMLGFMKNAKITQANGNAKAVYTAFNAVIADYTVDHATLKAGDSSVFTGTDIINNTENVEFIAGSETETVNFEMSSYLESINPEAYIGIKLNSHGTGVEYALYSLEPIEKKRIHPYTKKIQKNSSEAIVGCHPLKDE